MRTGRFSTICALTASLFAAGAAAQGRMEDTGSPCKGADCPKETKGTGGKPGPEEAYYHVSAGGGVAKVTTEYLDPAVALDPKITSDPFLYSMRGRAVFAIPQFSADVTGSIDWGRVVVERNGREVSTGANYTQLNFEGAGRYNLKGPLTIGGGADVSRETFRAPDELERTLNFFFVSAGFAPQPQSAPTAFFVEGRLGLLTAYDSTLLFPIPLDVTATGIGGGAGVRIGDAIHGYASYTHFSGYTTDTPVTTTGDRFKVGGGLDVWVLHVSGEFVKTSITTEDTTGFTPVSPHDVTSFRFGVGLRTETNR